VKLPNTPPWRGADLKATGRKEGHGTCANKEMEEWNVNGQQ